MADVSVKQGSMNGGVLGDLSKQWANRPADERITGINSWDARMNLQAAAEKFYASSRGVVMKTHQIRVEPFNGAGLVLAGSQNKAAPSYWAMTQLCQRAGVPAGYLREGLASKPDLAAACLNHGLQQRSNDEVGLLLTQRDDALQLSACTGPTYGRIWNADIMRAVNKVLDDKWTVPGIFGKPVQEITKANTSLFISSQDMFFGLTDETRKIEVPNRRNGQPGLLSRGVLIGNSEVGAGTLQIRAFLFDYACSNRNFWGVEDFIEVSIRHTSGAPMRFMQQAQPAIRKFLDASTRRTAEVLKLAQNTRVEDPFATLTKKFTRPAAQAIIEIHKKEEGRPIETLWDVNVGATAYARDLPWQDERVKIEKLAAEFMPKLAK